MEPRKPSRATAWLLPDLALALALFTLIYAVVFYRAPEQLFRDSDSGWHIRTGERILRDWSVPRVDPYSFSRPGRDWYAWEWAADAAMGGAHRVSGLGGVGLLYLAAIGVCSWLWVRLHWACGANFWIVCLLAPPMLTAAQLHWLARPHVLGWVWLLVSLLLLERGRLHWGWAIGLAAVWANTHGSFFLLPVVCALYAAGWRVIGAAVLGTFCNPYGWALHAHLARYLGDNELLSRIAEFQSFNFHVDGAWQIAAIVLTGMAGFVCALACGQWSRAAVLLLFCAMGLRSARGLPVLALAGLPLAGGAITSALTQWTYWPVRGRQAMAYGDRLRALDVSQRGWVLGLVCVVLAALAVLGSKPGFPPSEFPVAAVEHLTDGGNLLAPDKYGGFLIYRFNGARRVYFDGRSDYYGAEFLKEYVALIELRTGWEQTMKKYGFTQALLPARFSLIPALEKEGWKPLYSDATSVLLERNF
ncbi:MAG: hypothetical protein HYX27_12380 [Acidobacteria bacterium]|nr:hypothetical protein [Acidobacteriota bacterium]